MMVYVPEIDLQRYQSHLRDAYNQGYRQGHEDSRLGVKPPQDDAEPNSVEEAEAIHYIPQELIHS